MPKIRDSDSENNKDKSGDNTSATNISNPSQTIFLIFLLTSITFSSTITTLSPTLITYSFTLLITSSNPRNFSTKIRNSFSLSFCRFTKCVIINPVIVIINNTI